MEQNLRHKISHSFISTSFSLCLYRIYSFILHLSLNFTIKRWKKIEEQKKTGGGCTKSFSESFHHLSLHSVRVSCSGIYELNVIFLHNFWNQANNLAFLARWATWQTDRMIFFDVEFPPDKRESRNPRKGRLLIVFLLLLLSYICELPEMSRMGIKIRKNKK